MILVPRRLCQTADGRVCEASDPAARYVIVPVPGTYLQDAEAKRLGVDRYLEAQRAPAPVVDEANATAAETPAVPVDEAAPQEVPPGEPRPSRRRSQERSSDEN